MQYPDDTLLFLENALNVALNLKWILTLFEQVPGMRFNYHKNYLVPINLEDNELDSFLQIFQCRADAFRIKYLCFPLNFDKLRSYDLQPLIDKLLAMIPVWRGKLLSYLG